MHAKALTISRALVALAAAAMAAPALAQEYRVQEAASLASVPVGEIKPRTIVFADKPAEELIDAGTGFMRFEDWARGKRRSASS